MNKILIIDNIISIGIISYCLYFYFKFYFLKKKLNHFISKIILFEESLDYDFIVYYPVVEYNFYGKIEKSRLNIAFSKYIFNEGDIVNLYLSKKNNKIIIFENFKIRVLIFLFMLLGFILLLI
ncbi:MAG: hypothetical protein CMC14_11280 [Flavobacteriaceae bacterium]|nr:hypothetical protein [Flavobacteriaceae bacterium]|tara:strand:- start:2520 stop:2888 length:369 start_codon:yes stop_codon:yes gene_type:complete